MWENIGVTFKNYQRGKNSGLLGSGEPFTPSERAALRAWMDDIYEIFKGHVHSSRGDHTAAGKSLTAHADDLYG